MNVRVALGARRGLRGAVILADVVQCKTVRLGILRAKEVAGGLLSRLWACKGQGGQGEREGGGAGASLKVPSEWRGNFHM